MRVLAGLNCRISAGHHQQRAAHQLDVRRQRVRDLPSANQADDRHTCLKQAERKRDPDAQRAVSARHPDRDRRSEIAQTERHRDEQERKHRTSLSRATETEETPPSQREASP